jgi:hypothetical protein
MTASQVSRVVAPQPVNGEPGEAIGLLPSVFDSIFVTAFCNRSTSVEGNMSHMSKANEDKKEKQTWHPDF